MDDVESLPETAFGLAGVKLNNVVYMIGGGFYRDGFYEYKDWILEFESSVREWR